MLRCLNLGRLREKGTRFVNYICDLAHIESVIWLTLRLLYRSQTLRSASLLQSQILAISGLMSIFQSFKIKELFAILRKCVRSAFMEFFLVGFTFYASTTPGVIAFETDVVETPVREVRPTVTHDTASFPLKELETALGR